MPRLKLRFSNSESKHTYSPVILPAPLSAFNAFSFTCMHVSLHFWSFMNPPCIFLSMTLLLVLTLIYLLSIHCAGTLLLFSNELWKIEFIFCESGTIVRMFLLLDPYFLWDCISFLLWMPLKTISAFLCPSSHTLFLSLLAVLFYNQRLSLGFYVIWETLCPSLAAFWRQTIILLTSVRWKSRWRKRA